MISGSRPECRHHAALRIERFRCRRQHGIGRISDRSPGCFQRGIRVLRPDGYFIVTFSNRWFPTKAIKIWQELHEFERMGLVLEYFLRSGGFKDLQTYSMRGLPRPHDDKYFPELLYSDPVYAVWGKKK